MSNYNYEATLKTLENLRFDTYKKIEECGLEQKELTNRKRVLHLEVARIKDRINKWKKKHGR